MLVALRLGRDGLDAAAIVLGGRDFEQAVLARRRQHEARRVEDGVGVRLIAKVSKGSNGVWGTTPMPALDPSGKKQDTIKELVQFILALAK